MWLFDNSTSHNAYVADALNASVMNAKPGGIPCGIGKVQRMVFNIGIPKGLMQALLERDKYRKGMKLEEEIASHIDFKEEMTKLECFLSIPA